jgi:hypothetical protein
MVFTKVVAVCSCFLDQALVCKPSTDRYLGLSQSGLEEITISKPRLPTISLEKVGVDDKNEIIGDEVNHHY